MTRALLIISLTLGGAAWADLFSPGALSRPHTELEGLSQCTKCHPAGKQLSPEACVDCHQELEPRLGKGLGLHGKLPSTNRACEKCHHEHRGLDAPSSDWGAGGEKNFDHQRTGWALKGKHADTKCAGCHEPRLIISPPIKKLLATRPKSWLGVASACHECHFDEHRGQEKDECGSCHGEQEWKKAEHFNHQKTAYPLEGKHKQVKCVDCHDSERDGEPHTFPAPKSETFMRFAPVEHKTCLTCHKDPHQGQLGLRCESCHTVDGWKIIRSDRVDLSFHDKNDFPLRGAHIDVLCIQCHGPFGAQRAKFKGLAHDTCDVCHVEAHEGQLADKRGRSPDCGTCHVEQAFMPAKYGPQEHAATRYPLEGAHQLVACVACHPSSEATLKPRVPHAALTEVKRKGLQPLFSWALFDFDKPLDRCESCHQDVHDAQFKGQACARCHGETGWRTLTFDHDRDSRYPLEGAHAKVACAKCHFAPTTRGTVLYKPMERGCESCHDDVHVGQFERKGCDGCHTLTDWKTLRFRHEPPFTPFVLDGLHLKAKCEACHKPVQVSRSATVTKYKPLPKKCGGCHADHHNGEFKGFAP